MVGMLLTTIFWNLVLAITLILAAVLSIFRIRQALLYSVLIIIFACGFYLGSVI